MFRPHMRALAAAAPLIPFRAAAGGLPIVLGLFLAHRWGLAELAAFTVAHATVTIVSTIADWGAARALPRNLATFAPEAGARFLSASNVLRLSLVGAAAAGTATLIAAGVVDADAGGYLAILLPLCPLFIVTTNAVSERVVEGATRPIAAAVVAGLLTFAALGAIAMALGLGPRWLVAAYVTGKAVEAWMIVAGRWWVLSVTTDGVGETAAALWPFAAQFILGVAYSRLAVFTVEHGTTRAELGVFSVALSFQNAMVLVPASLALTQFPELTRRWREGATLEIRRMLVRYAMVSGLGVLLGSLALAGLAGPIAGALGVPLAMMPFVIAFASLAFPSSLNVMVGLFMQARGEERLASRLSVVTLTVALIYQTAAVSIAGLWGIVAAVAAAEVTTLAVFVLGLTYASRRDGR